MNFGWEVRKTLSEVTSVQSPPRKRGWGWEEAGPGVPRAFPLLEDGSLPVRMGIPLKVGFRPPTGRKHGELERRTAPLESRWVLPSAL